MNDEKALESARNKREEGYKAIFTNHADFLFTHALRILKDYQLAEDAVQDTFSAAFNALDTFRGDARLRTWLYQILYRNSIRIIEKNRGIVSSKKEMITESETNNLNTRLDVDKVLNKLNKRDRMVLILTYWDGLSLREVAEILEMKENNAKVVLFRARKQFAQFWS